MNTLWFPRKWWTLLFPRSLCYASVCSKTRESREHWWKGSTPLASHDPSPLLHFVQSDQTVPLWTWPHVESPHRTDSSFGSRQLTFTSHLLSCPGRNSLPTGKAYIKKSMFQLTFRYSCSVKSFCQREVVKYIYLSQKSKKPYVLGEGIIL